MEATRYWWSLASLIIVTALAAAGPSVAPSCADTCCVNTQLVQKNCHTTGCSGTIYVVECADNFGTGTNYQTMSVRCCTDLYNTLTSPSGRCAAAPTAGPTNVLHIGGPGSWSRGASAAGGCQRVIQVRAATDGHCLIVGSRAKIVCTLNDVYGPTATCCVTIFLHQLGVHTTCVRAGGSNGWARCCESRNNDQGCKRPPISRCLHVTLPAC